MDSLYNKHTTQRDGTLIANWQEERALKEFQGVGRTIVKEHIPKRHHDFENPIHTDKVFDNTNARIYGERLNTDMNPTSSTWGTGKNPAHAIPRVGLKTKAFEAHIMAEVQQELDAKRAAEDAQAQTRRFDTWQRCEYTDKDLTLNPIGKKVMKTQDGADVPMELRDDQLIVESGMWRRTQKATDDELKERIPQGDYTKTNPVTIYTEHLERRNHYMSASTGPNPFGVTRGMTQPVQATHAVNQYEGNVAVNREPLVH